MEVGGGVREKEENAKKILTIIKIFACKLYLKSPFIEKLNKQLEWIPRIIKNNWCDLSRFQRY